MAITFTCDRCGQPVAQSQALAVRMFKLNEYGRPGPLVDEFEVCQGCDREIRRMRVEAAMENTPAEQVPEPPVEVPIEVPVEPPTGPQPPEEPKP